MGKTLTYTQNGNYLVPDLKLTHKYPIRPIGKYGGLRLAFLQENRPGTYQHLIMSGELNRRLADIDEAATQRRDLIQQQMLKANPGPEKAVDMMGWIQHQNNILGAIDEIIFADLVYN